MFVYKHVHALPIVYNSCTMHLVESSPYTRHIQDEQMTALMFAVKVGSFDVVKMLAEHSASVFILDSVSTSCCIM